MKIHLPIPNDRETGYKFIDKIPGGFHLGEDLNAGKTANADYGLPVIAPFDGVIEYVQPKGSGWGVIVAYNAEIERWWRLGHLKDFVVKKGDIVKGGQIVGHCGKTGTPSPHCHFEVWKKKLSSWTAYPKNWTKQKIFEYFEAPFDFMNDRNARHEAEQKKNLKNIMQTKIQQTKWIPGLMWQNDQNCYCFALKHLMQYKMLLEKNLSADFDATKMYKDVVIFNKNRPVTNFDVLCKFAKEVGIYDKKTKQNVKIKDYNNVLKSKAFDYVAKTGPLLVGFDKETGEPIKQRLDKDKILTRRTGGFHAVVGLQCSGDVGQYMLFADSDKGNSGDGYWWFPRIFSNKILQVYDVIL